MSLDAHEFADALRLGMSRSGLDARAAAALEIHYLPLAMAVVEYLTGHLQVTVPAASFNVDGGAPNDSISCGVS